MDHLTNMKPIAERRTVAEILELSERPTPDEIKANYRRLVKQYHPDVNQTPEAAEYMVKLNRAYALATGRERMPQPRPQPQPYVVVRVWYTFGSWGGYGNATSSSETTTSNSWW
jgi:hypothetical protein